MTEARVMIVEDDVIMAQDLRWNLEASGYAVVGHAKDCCGAVRLAEQVHPDIILMDVYLEGDTNGIEAARSIQGAVDAAVIYVSGCSDASLLSDAARSGALGYIVKPFQARQLTCAIEIALHRRMEARGLHHRPHVCAPLPGKVAGLGGANVAGDSPDESVEGEQAHFTALFQRLQVLLLDENAWSDQAETRKSAARGSLRVTPREKEIIRGLICYRRLARVAEMLGISVHTARNHLKSVFRKLDLHSQDELLRFLLEGKEP